MSVADMVAISKQTRYVAGLPVAEGAVGGDPGPHTSYGVFLGVKAAVKRALGKDSLAGLHIAIQGAGSVAGGLARRAAAEGARLSIADVDRAGPQALAAETGGTVVGAGRDHDARGRRAQPQRARRDPRPRNRSPRSACRSSPAAPTTSSPPATTATASTRAASSTRPIM